jgi:hypothetical protein
MTPDGLRVYHHVDMEEDRQIHQHPRRLSMEKESEMGEIV